MKRIYALIIGMLSLLVVASTPLHDLQSKKGNDALENRAVASHAQVNVAGEKRDMKPLL